ncbi:HAD family hydrolase [Halorarius halobius]|uniref:HAD family hydrolase n=1 Tax=Halorarius halobius TaxID=2962671 RepID=UPI0020CEBDB3|nr:HAD family hydrolase [Halorarius halobius]
MSYDAVFWDIGGVIVELKSIRDGYGAFLAELCERYDLPYEQTVETWKTTLGDHFKSRDGTQFRSAQDGYVKATEAVFDGDAPDESEWWPLFERASAEAMRAEPGAVEAVRELAGTDVHQGIVSDIDDREMETMLGAFDVRDCFDSVTTSETVGYTKPDRRMFEHALDAWGGAAGDALMVGDRYEHDVEGAATLGFDAVAYGEEASGPSADYVVEDLRRVPDIARGDYDGS